MTPETTDRPLQGIPPAEQDYDLALWSEVLAMMAGTYELANRVTGANLPGPKIMELARGFADEFMRRRAAMLEGRP